MQFNLNRSAALKAVAFLLFAQAHASGSVIHVDVTAPDGGDGTEWALAYNDLHDALGSAQAGDEIWVAAGTYTPAPPDGDREISFEPVVDVPIYGGFAGWEDDIDQRDWVANKTILSGDLNGDDGPDFDNYDENSVHVVCMRNLDGIVTIDGFTITGGNADISDYFGGGVYSRGTNLVIANCDVSLNQAFFEGAASESGPTRSEGGGLYFRSGNLTLESTRFHGNTATHGGAIRLDYLQRAHISHCEFTDQSGAIGAVISAEYGDLTITDSLFRDNLGHGAACGFLYQLESIELRRCTFLDNHATSDSGAATLYADNILVAECLFAGNSAVLFGGAIGLGKPGLFVNCVFSDNTAGLGGGIYGSAEFQVINCSFSNNEGHGICVDEIDENEFHYIANSIFWGNTPEQVVYDPGLPSPPRDTLPTICYSAVEGGWDGPGWNNIYTDPLYVQPGADNLRLSHDSPCRDAGNNNDIPEGFNFDLDGNPRIDNGIVDMGAFEGGYEALPPGDVDYDIDRGDYALLIPRGGEFDPEEGPIVTIINTSGPDDAMARVTENGRPLHLDARGFSEVGSILEAETTIEPGDFKSTVYLQFRRMGLSSVDPLMLDLTRFDETTGNWTLAVSANTQDSPGYSMPIGDRHVSVAPDGWGTTSQMGDYGVYWDPDLQAGFVWANVDRLGDFGLGTALCRPDCLQPPDSKVTIDDLFFTLASWDRTDGPFDVNFDGTVDIDDVFAILAAWGACP